MLEQVESFLEFQIIEDALAPEQVFEASELVSVSDGL